MDEMTIATFARLGIGLAIGMLVGLQREKSDPSLAGVRTFALIGLAGTMTAILEQHISGGGWIIAAGILAIGSIVVASEFRLRPELGDGVGMTTAVAILIVYCDGIYLLKGSLVIAAAVSVTVAAILQMKPQLHAIAKRLGDHDMRAILQFAVFSCVVLPVLPNRQMGPLNVFNPFNIWLMVVLIVGISLVGYIAYKFFGKSAGVIVGGLLGGAISSTATSIGYSKKAKSNSSMAGLSTAVIVIASSVVFIRVLIELAVVSPTNFRELSMPIAIMLGACLLSSLIAWWMFRGQNEVPEEPTNPSELKSALLFGGLYALVLWALAATKQYFHSDALYFVAILSGLTDMDAITLSTGRMVEQSTVGAESLSPHIGWRLLLTAAISNLVFKSGIIAIVGGRQLFTRVALLFLIPISCGGLLLWFWI